MGHSTVRPADALHAPCQAGPHWATHLRAVVLSLLLFVTAGAWAQSKPEDKAAAADEARVVVFNRVIATFRAPFFGTTESRAQRTSAHIQELLARGGPGVVTTQSAPQGSVLLVDNEIAFILTPDDTDKVRGETLEAATRAARSALERVIEETRESRDRARILRALWQTGIATLLGAVGIWLIWRARLWLFRRLTAALERGAARMAVGDTKVLHSDRLVMVARWAVRAISVLLTAVIVYEWLSFAFGQFPYTRPWSEQLNGFLIGIAQKIGTAILTAIPDLTVALLIFLLARAVIALMDPFFDRIRASGSTQGWLNADTARPTQRLFKLGVWLFAIVMAYPYLPGSQSEAFKGMSVLIGLMITVGGAGLVGQAASGLILYYSRTLRAGEYVRIADHEGTVTEIGTFTTKLRTGLGEEVSLPNALILGNVSKNYSRGLEGTGFIVDTTVTIGYDTPWRQVEAMLLEAARRTPGVVTEPQPRVFQTSLSDFYPEYRLVCQAFPAEPQPRAAVLTMLHANIQDTFNEHGVQIMSPHYLGDPATAKLVPKSAWFTPPAQPPRDPAIPAKP